MARLLDERTASRRARRAILAGILLCAACPPVLAEETGPAPASAWTPASEVEVALGALTFPVEGVRQVTHVVAHVVATFASVSDAERHGGPGGVIRLRDATLGAVRDTRPDEVAEPIDVAAIERRIRRAISARAPALEGVRFAVLGIRTDVRP